MYVYVRILSLQWETLEGVCPINYFKFVSAVKISTKSHGQDFLRLLLGYWILIRNGYAGSQLIFKSSEDLLIFTAFSMISAITETSLSRDNSTLGRDVYFVPCEGRKLGAVLPSQFLLLETPGFSAPFAEKQPLT